MSKWYLKLFKRLLNSTVLNSFVYRQVTGRSIQALVQNSASGRSVYEMCACCRDTERTGATGIRQHNSTADWKTFSEKSGTQNWKIKTSAEVCCVLKARKKRKLQCTVAKYVMWVFTWKIALNCITWRSITEVMTIILLQLYSFKISLLKF